MNLLSTLLATSDVTLRRFTHEPDVPHSDPDHEVSRFDSINFIEGGNFDVRMDGRSWRLGPDAVFVTTRGMMYSCVHENAVPSDRCLSVSLSEQAAEDLRSAGVAALQPPLSRLTLRSSFLRRRLDRCGAGQELRLELVAGALVQAIAGEEQYRGSPRTARVIRSVERGVETIEAGYAQPLTLRDLGRAAGMSPYHFSRLFRAVTGIPPHRYLTMVRLRRALQLLRQGASVTTTCYAVGFGSLSHFITAFGRRFGVLPSEAARGARCTMFSSPFDAPVFGREA